MVLKSLYDELNVNTKFQKTLIAAMVSTVLENNNYGVTTKNYAEVKKALLGDELSEFEFDVLYLAADTWANDCADLLSKEIGAGADEDVFITIFNWLKVNEIIPGVGNKTL